MAGYKRYVIIFDNTQSNGFFGRHIQPNQEYCRKMTLEVFSNFISMLGTEPLTTGSQWIGQMVSHPLPVNAPLEIKDILMEKYKVEIPIFEWNGTATYVLLFRFIMKKDIDSLMSALDSIF